jgi:hypothetical protein
MNEEDDDDDKEKITLVKFDRKKSPWRWVVAIVSSFMLFGVYYCYDIPAALKTQLASHMQNPPNYELEFGLLYSLYSFPNVMFFLLSSLYLLPS